MKEKKTILIDFDGVLNDYKGNFNENDVPNIKKGARELLIKLSQDYEIKLFTTRNKIKTCKWLIKNEIDSYISDITNVKELAWVYVDDRCVKFEGDFSLLANQINNFKTWYR